MGAILAILGEAGDPELSERLERMIERSPYRGQPQRHCEGGLAIAIMTLGRDASLASWGNWMVAFHGYIGNWDELSRVHDLDLSNASSNAERIGRALGVLGDSLFGKLRGEFAIVIFDRRERIVLAIRDVVGSRPLFWEQSGGRTFIATEIRQVLAGSGSDPELDEDALVDEMLWREGSVESTLWLSVKRLPAAAITRIPSSIVRGSPSAASTWSPPEEEPSREDVSLDELASELRALLLQALRRSLPECPSAVSLSGGIDSSAIWGLLSHEAREGNRAAGQCIAISLAFPGFPCDERALIEKTLETTGTGGTILDCSDSVVTEFHERDLASVDAVFVPTLFTLDLVCGHAVATGHPVVFNGLGGDEWLRGSKSYAVDLLRSGRWLTFLNDICRMPEGGLRARYRLLRSTVLPALLRSALHRQDMATRPKWLAAERWERVASSDGERWRARLSRLPLARHALYLVLAVYQKGIGVEQAEQCAAALGAELRSPLCDADIMSFGFRTPARCMTGRGARLKHLLRMTSKNGLPSSVLDRTEKIQFTSLFARPAQELARAMDGATWVTVQRGVVDRKELDMLSGKIRLGTGSDYESFVLWSLWVVEGVLRRFSRAKVRV